MVGSMRLRSTSSFGLIDGRKSSADRTPPLVAPRGPAPGTTVVCVVRRAALFGEDAAGVAGEIADGAVGVPEDADGEGPESVRFNRYTTINTTNNPPSQAYCFGLPPILLGTSFIRSILPQLVSRPRSPLSLARAVRAWAASHLRERTFQVSLRQTVCPSLAAARRSAIR